MESGVKQAQASIRTVKWSFGHKHFVQMITP